MTTLVGVLLPSAKVLQQGMSYYIALYKELEELRSQAVIPLGDPIFIGALVRFGHEE